MAGDIRTKRHPLLGLATAVFLVINNSTTAAAAAAAIGGMEKRICCMVVQLRLARSPIITIPLPSLGSHSAWSPVCYAFAWD